MKLIITEKPSVSKAISEAIGANEQKDGYYEGNGYIVSWCYGHLVELAQPQDYDERYEKWRYEDLPIIPDKWQYKIKEDTRHQYLVLKELMQSSEVDSVVNACDAGREGENIFRHVYEMANCKKQMERQWISSMEESAVIDGMNHLHPGSEYDNLYKAALAREKADWLVGLNLTRNFTVLYNSKTLKIGRVQTPTLSMICDRELEITNFKKQKYYRVHLGLNGFSVQSDRIDVQADAENMAGMCRGKCATVTAFKKEHKKSAMPKLYDLTSLQMDASRLFGMTAKQTLDTTQALYEKKLVTYPRTDSKYLTHNEQEKVKELAGIICKRFNYLGETEFEPDLSAVINDKKVTDHHAIIPTAEIQNMELTSLSEKEKRILLLVVTRLIAAASKPMEYDSVKAEFTCEKTIFKASGKTVTHEGYKKYEEALKNYLKAKEEKEEAGEEGEEQKLPEMREGQVFDVSDIKVTEHFTKPSKRYTEATLLSQMEHAGEKEMDKDTERKGLGTTATRADIIEKIIAQGYVRREKKMLVPTDDGMNLINILPEEIKSVQMTVDMENTLAEVAKGNVSDESYLTEITDFIKEVISMYSAVSSENRDIFTNKNKIGDCPFCGGDVFIGKYGPYCDKKCGMHFGKVMGKSLSDNQWKDILAGKRILLKGLKSKTKDSTYDAYFTPETIEDYTYTDKDKKEHYGKQFKFKMSFPQRKK